MRIDPSARAAQVKGRSPRGSVRSIMRTIRPSVPGTFTPRTDHNARMARPLKIGVQLPEVEREVRWPELRRMAETSSGG